MDIYSKTEWIREAGCYRNWITNDTAAHASQIQKSLVCNSDAADDTSRVAVLC